MIYVINFATLGYEKARSFNSRTARKYGADKVFETIDRIHRYQIAHHLYGQGSYSYAQYRDSIKRNSVIRNWAWRAVSIIKRPLNEIWRRLQSK